MSEYDLFSSSYNLASPLSYCDKFNSKNDSDAINVI